MAEWLTLTAAAQRLGWHPRKVESRARRERWPRRAANRGRAGEYLVPAELLAGTAETTPPAAEPDVANPAELARLRVELAEVRAAYALALERAAKAEGRAEVLDAALVRELATMAELRRELAEARKPTLLRLLEAIRRR
jgi:hypothetical protein